MQSDDYRSRRRRDTSAPYKNKQEMIHDISNQLFHEKGVLFVEHNRESLSRQKRGLFNPDACCEFNDPEYNKQWYYVSSIYVSRIYLFPVLTRG